MNVSCAAIPGSLSSFALIFALALASLTAAEPKPEASAKAQPDRVSLDFVVGDRVRRVVIELDAGAAPKTVANFKKLVQEGFYDGLAVHRAINHYLVQMGDPLTKDDSAKGNWGTGSPGYTLPAEIKLGHARGAVAMARLPDSRNPSRASNGSQFYIALAEMPQLDGQYTVFGHVLSGIEHLDFITEQTTDTNDMPVQRIKLSAQIGEGEAKSAPVEALAQGAGTLTKGATSLTKGAVSAASQGVRAAGAVVKDVDKVIPKIDLPKVPFLGGKASGEAEAAKPADGAAPTEPGMPQPPPAAKPQEVILEEVPAEAGPKEKRLKLPSLPKFRKPDGSAFRDPIPSDELIPTSSTASLPAAPKPAPAPAPTVRAAPPFPAAVPPVPVTASSTSAPDPAPAVPPQIQSAPPTVPGQAPETDPEPPRQKRIFGKVITRFW